MIERMVYDGRTYKRNTSDKYRSHRIYFTRRYQKNGKRLESYLHRVVWEKHNGKIPKDCIIHHKDLNPDNNDISNLECVPEYLHARTFHKHRTPCEKRYPCVCQICGSSFLSGKAQNNKCTGCSTPQAIKFYKMFCDLSLYAFTKIPDEYLSLS